ncbi:hypothetical protein [Gordonia soli]|nr:hypothetical protein [Gordonia soli]
MTRSLTRSDGGTGAVDDDEYSNLELAEAELAAADAEAAAASARADAARARARVARLRQQTSPADEFPAADGSESTQADVDDPVEDAGSSGRGEVLSDDLSTEDSTSTPARTARGKVRRTAALKHSSDPQDPISSVDDRSARRRSRIRGGANRIRSLIRRPSRRGLLITLLGALTVAALVVTGVFLWQHRQADAERARAAEYTAAAERGVTALTSLDFRNADRDVRRVLDQSTGAFRADFQGRSDDFTEVIKQSQVTTQGRVTASALESLNDTGAVALVSATSDVTNAAGAKQEPRMWRLRVTMTDVDGVKKMSKVDFVP